MLLPKFTIRQMLLIMVGFAFISMIFGFAARGSVVAYGMGVAMLGIFVPFALYGLVYWIVLILSQLLPGGATPELLKQAKESNEALFAKPPIVSPPVDS